MSMITTSAWVPRGFAAPFPTKYNFDEDEFERIAQMAKLQLDDAKEDLEEAQEDDEAGTKGKSPKPSKDKKSKPSSSTSFDREGENGPKPEDDDLKEYDLEHYDDEEDEEDNTQKLSMFGNIKSLAYHESNKDDPYITLGDEEEENDEREELQILATDNLLLAAKIEDEMAHLEVYVYEDEADNLYVHHDIMLPAIPLCVEWLNIPVGDKPGVGKDSIANFVAIGSFEPDIEIWDLDTVDCMYPNAILGRGANVDEEKKRRKKRSKKPNDEYHVDAVLSLAANRKHRNLLASASADKTIKLWDLHTTKCAKSYSYHSDKVCSVAWHGTESTVLLSGSYDRTVAVADMRAPGAQPSTIRVESDVENVRWDPHDQNYFFVSTESGLIHYYDVRNLPTEQVGGKSVWKLQAHYESVSSFDLNPAIPGFMATGSTDKTVKLWNIGSTGPSMVASRDFDVGKVFSTTFAPDTEVAFRLAVAGSKGTISVWDTSTNPAVRKAFGSRIPAGAAEQRGDGVEDKLVGVDDNEDSSESDENEEEASNDGADSEEDSSMDDA